MDAMIQPHLFLMRRNLPLPFSRKTNLHRSTCANSTTQVQPKLMLDHEYINNVHMSLKVCKHANLQNNSQYTFCIVNLIVKPKVEKSCKRQSHGRQSKVDEPGCIRVCVCVCVCTCVCVCVCVCVCEPLHYISSLHSPAIYCKYTLRQESLGMRLTTR